MVCLQLLVETLPQPNYRNFTHLLDCRAFWFAGDRNLTIAGWRKIVSCVRRRARFSQTQQHCTRPQLFNCWIPATFNGWIPTNFGLHSYLRPFAKPSRQSFAPLTTPRTSAPVRFALQAYPTIAGSKTAAFKRNCRYDRAGEQCRIATPQSQKTNSIQCVSRCVRRSWLCRFDEYLEKSFEHRKPLWS